MMPNVDACAMHGNGQQQFSTQRICTMGSIAFGQLIGT